MRPRCLSGVALCLGLAGCTRFNPAYSESGTDGGSPSTGQTQTSSTPGSSTAPRETDTLDTQGPTGADDTTSSAESSTGVRPDPADCSIDDACGTKFDPCPPGSSCNARRDPQSNLFEASCLPVGRAPWGQACQATCASDVQRCAEGLVCAVWRIDPICLSRCGPKGDCDATDTCFVPGPVEPEDGGCEPIQPCDLLLQDCPIEGQSCLPATGDPECGPPQAGMGEGESCSGRSDCVAGLLCTPSPVCPGGGGGGGCCMQICEQDAEPPICACDDLGIPSQPSAGVCTTFPA